MKAEKTILSWNMHGVNFSPRHIQKITKLQFSYQHENGETITRKKHKLLMTDGLAVIKFVLDETVDWEVSIHNFLLIIEDNIDVLLANGLELLIFQVDILYRSQCNLELVNSFLTRISRLGATLAVSAYKV